MRSRFQHRFIGCVCLLAAVLALSCSRPTTSAIPAPSVDRLLEPVPQDQYADDVGRFLAGLPARPGSQLAGFHQTQAWITHRRELDRAWSHLEMQLLVPMRTFREQTLGTITGSRVFYPFSGPDSLMVTTFFPHSRIYVLVGLEPAGTLPAPRRFARIDLGRYLGKVRLSVASELGRSFFITRQMDRQFRGQITDGLFQPILHLLVRSNHTVLGFRYIRLDDAGQIVDRAADYRAPARMGSTGVEIDFRTDDDGSVHKLLYFSVNLSDEMLFENRPFLRFMSGLQETTTFLKATSYMAHKPEFSIIRAQVLSSSRAVLQDDSGIPYRFFGTSTWRVQLYGDYVRPYGTFRWLDQKDLRKAYQTMAPTTLGFRIGYGYGRIPSNLLLATRTE